MASLGRERDGYHWLWWYGINDNTRQAARGAEIKGSMLRAGRFILHWFNVTLLKLSWSFLGGRVLGGLRDWLTADVQIRLNDDEDRGATLHLSLSRLVSVWITVAMPRALLTPWMINDRVFGLRLGYIGDIAWFQFAHAEWAEDCGMTDYYRHQRPQKYTNAQLWPGWEIKLRWPPVLTWLLGRAKTDKQVISVTPVQIPLDGRTYPATFTLEQWETRRARWPWAYRRRLSSNIEVPNPPRFAGKGENSWDCGDDGIYGMGSSELSPASVVGQYVKKVLENRERYGNPSEEATA